MINFHAVGLLGTCLGLASTPGVAAVVGLCAVQRAVAAVRCGGGGGHGGALCSCQVRLSGC